MAAASRASAPRGALTALIALIAPIAPIAPIARASPATGDAGTRALTYHEALAAAAHSSPQARAAHAQSVAARATVSRAGALPNPRITLGVTTSTAYAFPGARWALPVLGQRSAAMDSARATVRVQRKSESAVSLNAQLAAAQAWIALWQAQQEAQLLGQSAARRGALVEAVQARVVAGAASKLDRIRAAADHVRAEADARASRVSIEAASIALAGAIGAPLDRPLRAAGQTPDGEVPSSASLREQLHDHPAMAVARARTRAASAAMSYQQALRIPTPILGFSTWVYPKAPDMRFSVAFDIPLFNGPLIDQERARRDALRTIESATHQRLLASALALRTQLIGVSERCASYLGKVRRAARENASMSSEAYRSGALDVTAWLLAEQARINVELIGVRCTAQKARAWIALEHARGALK